MACLTNTVAPASTRDVVSLRESGKCLAEYIWIGGGSDLKSRTVVLEERPAGVDDLPIAEIDGSSYGLSSEEACEVYLQPRKIFADPFRGGDHILVLCDTYVPPLSGLGGAGAAAAAMEDAWDSMQPHAANHRAACESVMQQAAYHQPLFSLQQEYSLYASGGEAFAVPPGSLPGLPGAGGAAPLPIKGLPAGLSSKASARLGRDVSELHMQACMAAGISYSGSHSAAPHQWAYKIGPCGGLEAADQLCVSRFLLGRVAEHSGAEVVYDAGALHPAHHHHHHHHHHHQAANKCVISFSTATSRDAISGLSGVQVMMERMRAAHEAFLHATTPLDSAAAATGGQHASGGSWHSALDAFGVAAPAPAAGPAHSAASGGSSGSHHYAAAPGTAVGSGSGGSFTVGVGNKHAAIMVPTSTLINGCGPILDRRPPASADPYLATMLLAAAACGLALPLPQVSAAQLAAALAAAAATATAAAASASPAMPILHGHHGSGAALSRRAAGLARDASFSSLGSGPYSCSSYGSSMLCGSADSHEVLLSALDRMDGYAAAGAGGSRGLKRRHALARAAGDDDDVCSDASSPPIMSRALAAAGCDDMFYE